MVPLVRRYLSWMGYGRQQYYHSSCSCWSPFRPSFYPPTPPSASPMTGHHSNQDSSYTHKPVTSASPMTGHHSIQDSSYTHKPVYSIIFSQRIWSWLLCPSVKSTSDCPAARRLLVVLVFLLHSCCCCCWCWCRYYSQVGSALITPGASR